MGLVQADFYTPTVGTLCHTHLLFEYFSICLNAAPSSFLLISPPLHFLPLPSFGVNEQHLPFGLHSMFLFLQYALSNSQLLHRFCCFALFGRTLNYYRSHSCIDPSFLQRLHCSSSCTLQAIFALFKLCLGTPQLGIDQ